MPDWLLTKRLRFSLPGHQFSKKLILVFASLREDKKGIKANLQLDL